MEYILILYNFIWLQFNTFIKNFIEIFPVYFIWEENKTVPLSCLIFIALFLFKYDDVVIGRVQAIISQVYMYILLFWSRHITGVRKNNLRTHRLVNRVDIKIFYRIKQKRSENNNSNFSMLQIAECKHKWHNCGF